MKNWACKFSIISSWAGVLIAVQACSSLETGGLFTGDTPPDAYAKIYCFEGRVAVGGQAPFGGGDALGEFTSNGLVKYGALPDAAVVAVAKAGCRGQVGATPEAPFDP